MRNIHIAITIFFVFLVGSAKAQNQQKHLVQLQGGLSWIGLSANIANTFNVVDDIRFSSSPALHLEYNHFFYDRVSLGVGLAYQQISAYYDGYEYEEGGETITENVSAELTRLNFSARALFWYNPNSTFRLYSGLRLGISNWQADTHTGDANFDIDQYINIALGAAFAPQIILLGGEIPINNFLRIGGELAVGSPYFISAGVSYAW